MRMFGSMNISASAMTANRLRMDTISANIANANTTRAQFVNGIWEPYRRKLVELAPLTSSPFDVMLQDAMGKTSGPQAEGVKVTKITEDQTPFKRVYQPEHPDADQDGYVLFGSSSRRG